MTGMRVDKTMVLKIKEALVVHPPLKHGRNDIITLSKR
jgi:hypothetical protein